jgi:hypothetical protein
MPELKMCARGVNVSNQQVLGSLFTKGGNRMWKKIFLVSISSVLCICNAAIAGRTWVSTQIKIDNNPINSYSYALAMRSGSTWPVISYTYDSEGRTAAMTPVGWVSGPAVGNIIPKYGINAATSPDGTAGFAYHNGFVLTLGRTGWSTYSYGSGTTGGTVPSIAFKNNNTPSVLYNTGGYGDNLTLASFNGQGWSQDTLGNNNYPSFWSRAFALEYDSYGQANVAFETGGRMMFGLKGVLTQNQWDFSSIDEYAVHPEPFRIDMAIGAGDIPWVAYTQQGYLRYATYDIHQQDWVNGILGQVGGLSGPGLFSMSADSMGGVGVAYIGANNMLTLAYNNGSGSWSYDIGIAQGWGDVSLAFDSRNNPVICYTDKRDGFLHLAYDPASVPEPGTLSLLIFGAGFFISAKKRK